MMKILIGHVSPETAFIVDDYPYGFRLRCKIRYWLESSPNKGIRFCSQTTNPKKNNIWNKPKVSTYFRFGGCMFLDENSGHVGWTGVSEYGGLQELLDWKEKFYVGVPDDFKPTFDNWLRLKITYNNLKAKGEVAMVTTTTNELGEKVQEKTILKPEIVVEKTQESN